MITIYKGSTRSNIRFRGDYEGSVDLTGVTFTVRNSKSDSEKPFNGALSSIVTESANANGSHIYGDYDVQTADLVVGKHKVFGVLTFPSGEKEIFFLDVVKVEDV